MSVTTTPVDSPRPFVKNPRAYLVHRVKSATHVFFDTAHHHDSVVCVCGSLFTSLDVVIHTVDSLLDNDVMCSRCEAIATVNGQRSTSEICGKHIHTGMLTIRTNCCGNIIKEIEDAK